MVLKFVYVCFHLIDFPLCFGIFNIAHESFLVSFPVAVYINRRLFIAIRWIVFKQGLLKNVVIQPPNSHLMWFCKPHIYSITYLGIEIFMFRLDLVLMQGFYLLFFGILSCCPAYVVRHRVFKPFVCVHNKVFDSPRARCIYLSLKSFRQARVLLASRIHVSVLIGRLSSYGLRQIASCSVLEIILLNFRKLDGLSSVKGAWAYLKSVATAFWLFTRGDRRAIVYKLPKGLFLPFTPDFRIQFGCPEFLLSAASSFWVELLFSLIDTGKRLVNKTLGAWKLISLYILEYLFVVDRLFRMHNNIRSVLKELNFWHRLRNRLRIAQFCEVLFRLLPNLLNVALASAAE